MKPIQKLLAASFLLGGFVVLLNLLHAQETEMTAIQVQPLSLTPADLQTFPSLSEAQVTALLNALDATPTIPAEALPSSGTFWSLQEPNSAPYPGNINQLPAWKMSGCENSFLLSDVGFDYTVQARPRNGMRMMSEEDGPPGFDDIDDSGTNTYQSGYSARVYTTNELWLSITGKTNTTAYLVIHPPWNVTNGVYDLYYTTNLSPPVSWRWLLRSDPGQTNLIVPNATDPQGFYQLGPFSDLTANSSLGTNFWLTFCNLSGDSDNDLSLYISSPVGATGALMMPGLLFNDSVFTVTNCADATVNGTYVLTIPTPQEQTDWHDSGYFDSTLGPSYVKGADWVSYVRSYNYWLMFEYDSGTHDLTFLYYKYGLNLNGSDADWQYDGDTNSGANPTSVCMEFNYVPFTVAAGGATNISLSLLPDAMIGLDDVVETNGIHVTANQPVSVYGLAYNQTASAAFTAYPTPLLGTNYCVMARAANDGYDSDHSQFAIVATADDTTVTITPSATANLIGSLWTNAFTLQQGQTYEISSTDDTGDVTGTLIASDKPIGVFAGANLAFVPEEADRWANPLVQEQLPINTWGTQALAMSFAGRMGGDTYRVLAANNNTVVFTNGVVAGTNQAGQFLEMIIDGPVEFKGSKPIQVAHFANGHDFDGQLGDPCEILLPPTGHYLETNTIIAPTGVDFPGNPYDFDENYLSIIVAQSAITNTLVDGSSISATNFIAIGSSGYYGAQVTLTNSGVHTVTSSQPVGVEVYGFGYYDAYGYFGGIVK